MIWWFDDFIHLGFNDWLTAVEQSLLRAMQTRQGSVFHAVHPDKNKKKKILPYWLAGSHGNAECILNINIPPRNANVTFNTTLYGPFSEIHSVGFHWPAPAVRRGCLQLVSHGSSCPLLQTIWSVCLYVLHHLKITYTSDEAAEVSICLTVWNRRMVHIHTITQS